jgi:hypothetical protein
MKTLFTKKWFLIVVILIACAAGIQLIRPQWDNPPVTADISAPPEMEQILKKACYDCHSNETKLAWFDKTTPANFLVAGHIKEGRKVLNFSTWDSLTKDQQKGKLFESFNQIVFNVMPLKQYSRFHPGSAMSGEDIAVLKNYLGTMLVAGTPDSTKTKAADHQYGEWIQNGAALAVKPAPNGIAFVPEYKNWKAISTTERADNGTMRVILGNDEAINAIKTQHINPWPDGTMFAKVAWDQLTDPNGVVHTGEFKQVEFMIRDSKKYASTHGWGFARWVKGLQLIPYGKNALFTTECVNCHQPMQHNDFVFTSPLNLTKKPDSLSFNPLEWKVICSGIDKGGKTMSTLYGNDIAVNKARTNAGNTYPAGSALALVTWLQQEDTHWYGANIPGSVKSIELIKFIDATKNNSIPSYENYEGTLSRKSVENNPEIVKARIAYIINQKASVIP